MLRWQQSQTPVHNLKKNEKNATNHHYSSTIKFAWLWLLREGFNSKVNFNVPFHQFIMKLKIFLSNRATDVFCMWNPYLHLYKKNLKVGPIARRYFEEFEFLHNCWRDVEHLCLSGQETINDEWDGQSNSSISQLEILQKNWEHEPSLSHLNYQTLFWSQNTEVIRKYVYFMLK